MPFSNPIIGGGGALVYPSIRSPNYDADAGTGWAIFKDGSAVFYSISLPNVPAGTKVTFSATEPPDPNTDDVWYDTGNGLLAQQWDGTDWVPYQIASGAIAPGGVEPSNIASLTASLIGNLGVLNPNPYFTGEDSTGWHAFQGTFSVTAAPPAGAPFKYAGVYVNNGTTAGAMEETGGPVPVTPGHQYLATAWVYSSNGNVRIGFDWTLAKVYVSTGAENITVPANTWTQVTTVQTAPAAGVDGGYLRVGSTAADGATTYAQAITALPQVPGTLIEAGTITAAQIAAAIVIAGIVDGTTIEGATLIASGGGTVSAEMVSDALKFLGVGAQSVTFLSAQAAGSNATRPQATLSGPCDDDAVPQVILAGESEDGTSPATVILQAFSLAASQGAALTVQVNGTIAATKPGSVSGSAPSGTPEDWTTLSPPSGWGGSGQQSLLRYRLMADNSVRIQCNITASAVKTTNPLSLGTLGSGYLPSNAAAFPAGTNDSAAGNARVTVNTSGAIALSFGAAPSYSAVGFVVDIPLD